MKCVFCFAIFQGMDSGFGDDEAYNVYDKAWRADKDSASHIYRPTRNKDRDVYGDDLDEIIKTNRLDVFLYISSLQRYSMYVIESRIFHIKYTKKLFEHDWAIRNQV